jgi:hypothetical protein
MCLSYRPLRDSFRYEQRLKFGKLWDINSRLKSCFISSDLKAMCLSIIRCASLMRVRLEGHVPVDHPLRKLDAGSNFDQVRSAMAEHYTHTCRITLMQKAG